MLSSELGRRPLRLEDAAALRSGNTRDISGEEKDTTTSGELFSMRSSKGDVHSPFRQSAFSDSKKR